MNPRRSLPKTISQLGAALDERFDALDRQQADFNNGQNLLIGQTNKLELRMRELEGRERERNGQIAALMAWRETHEAWAEAEQAKADMRIEVLEEEHHDGRVRALVWRQVVGGALVGGGLVAGLIGAMIEGGLIP